MSDDAPIAAESAVFVSYASPDAVIANSIVTSLERSGFRCWIAPRDVVPGSLYADGIVRAINGTQFFVLVLSEHAVASAHVGKEIERASSKRHPIFAVRIDAAPLTLAFEYFLSESQWIDVGTGGVDAAAARLVSAIRKPPAPSHHVIDSARPHKQTQRPAFATKRPFWSLAIAATLVAGGILWVLADGGRQADKTDSDESIAVAPPSALVSRRATPALSEKSIAVLPFTDMSEKKDQEYFGDGMAEEILDLLAKVPGLRVIGRTSSFQFKGKNDDLRGIGSTLGVAHIVEGSVRRSRENIRVTAQLIRSLDGVHEWSESYDRPLSDALKVQQEIATGIVRALQVTVGAAVLSVPQMENTDAYDLYLRGAYAYDRYEQSGFETAAGYFQQALDLEPSFTRAAEYLALTRFLQVDFGFLPAQFGFERSRKDAENLLRTNPDSTMGHHLLARIHTDYDWDWDAAKREIDAALATSQRSDAAFGNYAAGALHRALGQFDDAVRSFNAVLTVDPLNADTREELGSVFYRMGRLPEAAAEHAKVLEISPSFEYGHVNLAFDLLAMGKPEAALAETQLETNPGAKLQGLAVIHYALGHKAQSDAALQKLKQESANIKAWEIASVHAFRREANEAFQWLDRAYQQKDFELLFTKGDPFFASLESDDRYKPFLRKMRMPE